MDDVKKHKEIYIIIFLWCFINLIKAYCEWAETCRIKTIQRTKRVQLWLAAVILTPYVEIRSTLQSTVTLREVVWLWGLTSSLPSAAASGTAHRHLTPRLPPPVYLHGTVLQEAYRLLYLHLHRLLLHGRYELRTNKRTDQTGSCIPTAAQLVQ